MTVLALSGGLDSAVLLAVLLADEQAGAFPVFFRYGSKHNTWEEAAAVKIAAHYGLALHIVDLVPVFASVHSALLGHDSRPIPAHGYDESTMAQTLVPGRNMIFASVLASLAESRKIPAVALATHAGDHHLYPDCRPSFNRALGLALQESSGGTVQLYTPFSAMDKAAIVAEGIRLGVPLALTRSCYAESEKSCGLCGTCRERMAAFKANGVADPGLSAT